MPDNISTIPWETQLARSITLLKLIIELSDDKLLHTIVAVIVSPPKLDTCMFNVAKVESDSTSAICEQQLKGVDTRRSFQFVLNI